MHISTQGYHGHYLHQYSMSERPLQLLLFMFYKVVPCPCNRLLLRECNGLSACNSTSDLMLKVEGSIQAKLERLTLSAVLILHVERNIVCHFAERIAFPVSANPNVHQHEVMFLYSCYKVPCLAKEIVADIIRGSGSRNFPQATLGRGSIVLHAAPRCFMLLSIVASSQPLPRYMSVLVV